MKNILTISLMMLTGVAMQGQIKVALHHNGTVTMFSGTTPFISAYNASVNGDTIYLPGGLFSAPAISKGIYIIGAGHYPDSSTATLITSLANNININTGADKLKLEGLNIPNLYFANGAKIDSVVFLRCNIGALSYAGTYDISTNCVGHLLYQNIISNLTISRASNIRIFNNIISTLGSSPENTWVKNNKIDFISDMTYCFFENNIIQQQYAEGYNTFRNNIFEAAPGGGTNSYLNNYNNHPFPTVFVSYTNFSNYYIDNLHLLSPGTYIGTDATQVGLYGGLYPYKEGAVPSNPHIRSKSIGLTPDVNGKLKVNFTVAAQNN